MAKKQTADGLTQLKAQLKSGDEGGQRSLLPQFIFQIRQLEQCLLTLLA